MQISIFEPIHWKHYCFSSKNKKDAIVNYVIFRYVPSKLHTDYDVTTFLRSKLGQALDLLVTVSSMYYYTSTSALSTL